MKVSNEEKSLDNITVTDFDYEYDYSEKCGSDDMKEYVYHHLSVSNKIGELRAVYRGGQSLHNDDQSLPYTQVELCALGTHPILVKLDDLENGECFTWDDAKVKVWLDDILALGCTTIKSRDDINACYDALMDNNAAAEKYAETVYAELTPLFHDE